MVTAHTHLHFNGNCAEAMKFYEQSLGGQIVFSMTWAESPDGGQEAPAGWRDKIMHSALVFNNQMLIADDAFPGHYQKPQGFHVLLSYEDLKTAERVFKALSAGGEVQMPFEPTFWAQGFGVLVDKFGTPWMLNVSNSQSVHHEHTGGCC